MEFEAGLQKNDNQINPIINNLMKVWSKNLMLILREKWRTMTQICFKSCHYHLSRSCQSKPSAARIIQKSDPRGLSIYKVKELSPLKPPLDLPTNLITWTTLMHMHMRYVTRFDFHEVHVIVNTTLAGKN